jgi:hypothetical protein
MWTCEHGIETTADATRIWDLWHDVAGWSGWNAGVADAELIGPFAAGSTIVMTLPEGEVVPLTLDAVEVGVRFVDVAAINGLIVRTEHRLEPIGGTGRLRVVYALTVTGEAPADVLEEVGRAVSGDFPDVIASLLATANRPATR